MRDSEQENYPPTLTVSPSICFLGNKITIHGRNWPDCPVKISFGKQLVSGASITCGLPHPEGVRPNANGTFAIIVDILTFTPGDYDVTATSTHLTRQQALAHLEVKQPPTRIDDKGRVKIGPLNRIFEYRLRRFKKLGYEPAGVREVQVRSVRQLRTRSYARDYQDFPGQPLPDVCNWTPVGAGPVPQGQTAGGRQAVSGRAISLAIDPTNTDIIYVGTASGGIWKSTDAGTTWSPKTDYTSSLSCESLAIDPNNPQRIFAGTGEYQAGTGLLRSDDAGETWTELAKTRFWFHRIFNVLFDPTDSTSQRLFVASNGGVYESIDGGNNWTQLKSGIVSDLLILVESVAPLQIKLIAALWGDGLWTSTRIEGAGWSAWSKILSPSLPEPSAGRIVLSQCKGTPTTIHALFAAGYELDRLTISTDGGITWNIVDIQLEALYTWFWSSQSNGHSHSVQIPVNDLTSVAVSHTYSLQSAGNPIHDHTITLTANQVSDLAMGRLVNITTDVDATGHTHDFSMGLTRQCGYNLVVATHPTNPDKIFIGEASLWKNTTGGGIFRDITDGDVPMPPAKPIGIHADQHVLAFDPVNPNRIWVANDGGVFRSEDEGATWTHCNRDLATLQYNHVSLHPQWDTFMLGGTQDNGTHRYIGSPAWEFSDYGDGGFTAINPLNPQRCYHGYISNTFYRSDNAGAEGTWTLANTGISGNSIFYPPFILDPVDPNICYFGNSQLWRSSDGGDTWYWVTYDNEVGGIITTLAVDPSDTNKVYVAATDGNVYLIERTGANWDRSIAPADIIVNDLTAGSQHGNLPANVWFSDLAIDSSGSVWITVSSVYLSSPGVFSNSQVFRLIPGAGVWENRSNGLAQANPINTIVIDPTNDNRLFCGGDIGVFRTDDAGANWIPWDVGLPNAPVLHLAIHGPQRLLRAATYGRSVWQHPIDTDVCQMVDLYLRDCILDSGRIIPSPSGYPNPIAPSENAYYFQSVDVKVDAPEPLYQTTIPVADYVAFAELQHRTPRRGRINRFYVQVHNRGIQKATGVRVRAFFANASGGLPPLPSDFWSMGNPFDGTPSTTNWTPVGNTIELGTVEAAEPAIAIWEWLVPTSSAIHSCLLVLATCNEDPLTISGVSNVDWLVPNEKRATLKNLHVEDAVPGSFTPSVMPILIDFHATIHDEGNHDLVIMWGSLPLGTHIFFAFENTEEEIQPDVKDETLLNLGIEVIKESSRIIPQEVEGPCGSMREFNNNRILQITRDEAQETIIPGFRIQTDTPLGIALRVILSEETLPGQYHFDILHRIGERFLGGSSYILRVKEQES